MRNEVSGYSTISKHGRIWELFHHATGRAWGFRFRHLAVQFSERRGFFFDEVVS